MKSPFPHIAITSKLSLLLLVFVLIFYGTLVHVFMHIQKMMNVSEEIVSINNIVAGHSKVLIEKLLEMDANAKKFSLLNKDVYREYFEASQKLFDTSLSSINHLSARGYTAPAVYSLFLEEYTAHRNTTEKAWEARSDSITWVDETTLNSWVALLVQFRDANQAAIETSLMHIHDLTRLATRNGLLGFGLSVLTSFFGVWFISKSILIPLKQLTRSLRSFSLKGYSAELKVTAAHEFQDLANAYNEMHTELQEQENLRADFIASLSHELRTPLSSIQESVNMLREEVLGGVNDRQRKFLSIASAELSRITDLLNHLMDVSMLESQKQAQKAPQIIEPRQCVLSCITSLSTAAAQKNIIITEHCEHDCGVIQGQPEELQQILINIIGNAIKFSPTGGEIRIYVLKAEKSGYVLFNITDQGPGIPENEQSLIFKKFYRSASVRKRMSGVGLGLYISRKIVQAMGGTIHVTNNPGEGCTFSVCVPAA